MLWAAKGFFSGANTQIPSCSEPPRHVLLAPINKSLHALSRHFRLIGANKKSIHALSRQGILYWRQSTNPFMLWAAKGSFIGANKKDPFMLWALLLSKVFGVYLAVWRPSIGRCLVGSIRCPRCRLRRSIRFDRYSWPYRVKKALPGPAG